MLIMYFFLIMHGTCNEVEITAGAFWKPLPATLTYEASVPLTYSSKWYNLREYKEEKENMCKGRQECEIPNKLMDIVDAFDKEFASVKNSYNVEAVDKFEKEEDFLRRESRSLDFLGEGLSWCCGVATQHKLDTLKMNENKLKQQLQYLHKGLSESLKGIAKNSEKFKEYENQARKAFEETEKKRHQLEKYFQNIANETVNLEGMFLELVNHQYQNTKRIILLLRSFKNQAIINSCKQHQIPASVLEPTTLQHDLKKLEEEITSLGQGLAIPVSDIYRYYQLPICDCSVLDTQIVISVRVPITQINVKWNLFELITTPFAWQNETCRIEHGVLYLAVPNTPTSEVSKNIRQISGLALHQCRPYNDKLCFLPRFAEDLFQGPACAKKLYEGSTVEDISNHCPMNCHSSTAMTITEINEELYVVTHTKVGTKINCDKLTQSIILPYQNIGAQKVKLPCHCKLQINNELLIPSRFPCFTNNPREAKINHIIPATWSNLKSFVLNPVHKTNLPTYRNLSECINHNWTLNIPHINLTTSNRMLKDVLDSINENDFTPSFSDTYGFESHSIMLIWNTILSIVLIFLIFKYKNLIILTSMPAPTKAQNINVPSHHNVVFALICTMFSIFLLYLSYKIVMELLKHLKNKNVRNRNKVNTTKINKNINNKNNPGTSEQLYKLSNGENIKIIISTENLNKSSDEE